MKSAIRYGTVVVLACSFAVHAQTPVGYDFLRTFVGARPAAMAGAFVAVPGDLHGLNYNPAGLAQLTRRQGSLTYLNHLLDFNSGFIAYAQPVSKGAVAAGLHFFDYGKFDGKDENNLPTGEFGANSMVFSAGYAREVARNLALGVSGKYIRFGIENFSSSAVATDVGLLFSVPAKMLHFGLGVFNLGTVTSAFIDSKDNLPMSLQFGLAKKLEHLPLFLTAALVKFRDESLDFRIGGEFTLREQLFLRFGYNSVGKDQKVSSGSTGDNLAGFSLGAGIQLRKFDVDYSYSAFGEVGALNRITLIGKF
jgi:hypothetical protein